MAGARNQEKQLKFYGKIYSVLLSSLELQTWCLGATGGYWVVESNETVGSNSSLTCFVITL
jgi:hypothetical protein